VPKIKNDELKPAYVKRRREIAGTDKGRLRNLLAREKQSGTSAISLCIKLGLRKPFAKILGGKQDKVKKRDVSTTSLHHN